LDREGNAIKIVSFTIVLLFLLSGLSFFVSNASNSGLNVSASSFRTIKNSDIYDAAVTENNGPSKDAMLKISYPLRIDNSTYLGGYSGIVTVMVTFKLNNETSLLDLLRNISSPNSDGFHRYITRSDFEMMFSPSIGIYNRSLNYFKSFGVNVQSYSDRISIVLTGPSSIISRVFNVSFGEYENGQNIFYSIDQEPSVPYWMAPYIAQISGLDDYYRPALNYLLEYENITIDKQSSMLSGYPSPIIYNGVQEIYGSDLQVAYDEQSLFNFAYPVNEVVATILWSGQYVGPNTTTPYGNLTNGTLLGPFDPSDIYSYYNDTLPSWEPHSKVIAVPLDGAPEPGPLASYDTSGAVGENTLDLEMVGSTAPGATIFNVYGPTPSNTYTDQALAFILNPNSSFSELNKVSVISNSWGSPEYNDTAWYEYLQEAQARGITVLASSGDSGDNANSSKYLGSNYPNDWVEFPSSMAYNYFGVTAVGGTTLTLNSSLNIESQVAWYISSRDTANGGPAGSTGGISEVFPEPIWQSDTIANKVINGQGRGVPDIAAIANNTIIYITVDGTSYYSGQYPVGGTSVASPVEAGIVAEINAVLSLNNQTSLGYLNPLLYTLGNEQLSSLTYTDTTGYDLTGSYNSSLPTLPFYNVYQGRNHIYNATYRYNLVTGWGSIDAYNLTMYVLNKNYSGVYGALDGVENILNLTGLNVTSYFSNGTINTAYNASIQQNFFVANSLGAPVYWIQNVIYIKGSQKTGWIMNYTGWVIYPFYGLYRNATVYEYNFPAGKFVSLPHTFVIKTWISNEAVPMDQIMNFQVNSQILQISVPGASFIIGSYNYSYLWEGKVHTNGPYPSNANPGGLAPQFSLVGGPSASTGDFEAPTAGYMEPYILPIGLKNYISPITYTFTTSNDQTGEFARNLNWVNQNGNWYLSTLTGNNIQGIISVEPNGHPYNVTFIENGLLPGTSWSVTLNGTTESSTTDTIAFSVPNGTYSYTIGSVTGYTISTSSGSITVNGANVNQAITFTSVATTSYTITFTETGLPSSTLWSVTLNGLTLSSTTNTISFDEPNGTYSYIIGSITGYTSSPSSGTLTVYGANVNVAITFTPISVKTYSIKFIEAGLPSGYWYVNITGQPSSGPILSSQASYSVSLPNGSYSYTVSTGNKEYKPSYTGSFTVNGASVSQSITFSEVSYNVTFTESGLPTGATWNVTLNGAKSSSTTSSISFSEPNGTYSYTVGIYNGYSASPYSNSVTVNGGNLNIAITFTRVTYTVTFTESGLASGTWYVNITTTSQDFSEPDTTTSISFSEPNGTYSFTVATNYKIDKPLVSSGSFTVNGASVSESITFSEVSYNVTFTESGLPTGATWNVTLNGVLLSRSSSSISFSEPNGTYSYTIGIYQGYSAFPYSGTVTVNGANVNVAITFTRVTYSVTFTESGLPSGNWYVNLSNGQSFSSTTDTITFTEPNGSYTYSISSSNKEYAPLSPKGSFTVNGSNLNIPVSFHLVTYEVTFSESGLPSGYWYVNITDQPSSGPIPSSQTSYSVSLPNGSYSYTVSTGYKEYKPSYSGLFTVNGASISESITFSEVTFTVTFTESGLPTGATWNVTLNGIKLSSSSFSLVFNEPNGTYSYTIGIYQGYSASPYFGTVTVNGGNVNVAITFTQVKYSVTFTESGLSSGTSWSVTLNGLTETSTNATLTFNEPNGTYSYVISGISGYRANSYSGTINVNGNPVSNSITWSLITYPITITENGISNGTSWSATLTGTTFNGQYINITLSSTTNTLTFNEPNGSYSYTIHLPSGYQSNNAKGSVNVSGNSETATFTAQRTMNYLLIGIIAVIVIILLALGVIFLMRSKNKQKVMKQKEPPKES